MDVLFSVVLPFLTVFASTVIITRKIIPVLKSRKMGQKILEIGPRWHKSKEGTPTMGGIAFFIPVVVFAAAALAVYAVRGPGFSDEVKKGFLALLLAVMNGAIGIYDDMKKVLKKENEGLTARQKYLLQVAAAVIFLALMRLFGLIDTRLAIPFTGISIELGFFYYILSVILITGIVNSVNLTDGIDGLLSGVMTVIGVFFIAAGFRTGLMTVVISGSCICGASTGFLVYNFHPARIFMGDTGSLFFGGLVSGVAFITAMPYLMLLYGLLFVIESFSVIIQVTSFKLTGKRVFKMSPIHHHFEMCGWGEIKICAVFSAFTLICCVVSYFAL